MGMISFKRCCALESPDLPVKIVIGPLVPLTAAPWTEAQAACRTRQPINYVDNQLEALFEEHF